jgi:sarcosine oxidase, subunit gamma
MANPLANPILPSKSSTLAVVPLVDWLVLRLKSWQPTRTADQDPVAFDSVTLPPNVGNTTAGSPRALCTGPGEWLLVDERKGATGRWREEFERWAIAQGVAVADLSHGLVGFALKGTAAGEVLAKGCGIDVHAKGLLAGRCVRTRLAQIPAVIDCHEPNLHYGVYVARSYREYLRQWLDDALIGFPRAIA